MARGHWRISAPLASLLRLAAARPAEAMRPPLPRAAPMALVARVIVPPWSNGPLSSQSVYAPATSSSS